MTPETMLGLAVAAAAAAWLAAVLAMRAHLLALGAAEKASEMHLAAARSALDAQRQAAPAKVSTSIQSSIQVDTAGRLIVALKLRGGLVHEEELVIEASRSGEIAEQILARAAPRSCAHIQRAMSGQCFDCGAQAHAKPEGT